MDYKYAIALTGSIATGKSTVASLLTLHGIRIIDADSIAHKLLDDNANSIASMFSEKFIENNKVNRKIFGPFIFKNPDKRKELEDFLHPKIKNEIFKQSRKLEEFKFPYLIDIPLFFEKNNYPIENSVVVYTTPQLQLERLIKRDNLTKDEAQIRINSQISINDKKEKATWIIDNTKDLKSLQKECEKFVSQIKQL